MYLMCHFELCMHTVYRVSYDYAFIVINRTDVSMLVAIARKHFKPYLV